MIIFYDEVKRTVKIARNHEYRKWLNNIDILNQIAGNAGINPFGQNRVEWEEISLDTPIKEEWFLKFKNFIESSINEKNKG